jgi:sugar phosphate isomerase/epimerase
MTIGLGTYTFFWRGSDRTTRPFDLDGMLAETARLGVSVFQICDYPEIESYDQDRLEATRTLAASLGITLELGTRGTRPTHLRSYLRLAQALDASLVRSMWTSGDDRPGPVETEERLREIVPDLEQTGVTLALETYEQIPSTALVALVEKIGCDRIGICLDPANTVANLELPSDVTARCAPHVKNWHVKDFDFSRAAGWVGFTLSGTSLGEGRLDYEGMLGALRPRERGINQIVEFWLPWQGDPETTVRREAEWTTRTLEYLRSRNHD